MSLLLAVVHLTELRTILPAVAAGAAAVFVLLPRPRPYPSWLGALFGAAAVLLAGATVLRTGAVTAETFLFYAFSFLAVVSGVLLVTQHNPARAALSFALVILSTCGLFLLLAAPFLMAATIIIYAGAIIVTFLFVLMLAQQEGPSDADQRSREPLLASLTGFILLGALVYVLQLSYEKSEVVQAIDDVLAEVRTARARVDELEKADELGGLSDKLKAPVQRRLDSTGAAQSSSSRELKDVRDDIENTVGNANSEAAPMKAALDNLEARLLIARQRVGWLQPHVDKDTRLSNFSGPNAGTPKEQLRYDAEGRPQLPAENAAYLGRSLFTDYLLPVELGGFLLLVAVVGSVAIAHRRTTPEGRP